MPTTTNNTLSAEQQEFVAEFMLLRRQVFDLNQEIARLKGRGGKLSEDLDAMKVDIANFRRRVTEDMTALIKNVQEEIGRRP